MTLRVAHYRSLLSLQTLRECPFKLFFALFPAKYRANLDTIPSVTGPETRARLLRPFSGEARKKRTPNLRENVLSRASVVCSECIRALADKASHSL